MTDHSPSRQQCEKQNQTSDLLMEIHLENDYLKETDKADYFNYLYGLTKCSQEEEMCTEARDFLRKCKPATTVSEPPSKSPSEKRSIPPESPTKKMPEIYRTQSAPVSSSPSVVKETPLPRKTSLLRYDISTPPSQDISFDGKQATSKISTQGRPGTDRRSVSDPLILTNSNGIDNMLKKNQTRKREPKLKLVPENQQIFKYLTFFYIPNDDTFKPRKKKIENAIRYGATWARKFDIDTITHIMVDHSFLTYKATMEFLKEQYGLGSLPNGIRMLTENYPVDCIKFKMLCDPDQKIYELEGQSDPPESQKSVAESEEEGNNNDDQREQTQPHDSDSDSEKQPEHVLVLQSGNISEILANTSNLTEDNDELASRELPKDFGNSEFNKTVMTVQKTPYFLDDSDYESSTRDNAVDSDSDSERDRSPIRKPAKKKQKTKAGLNFACMKVGTGATSGPNPNDDTIKAFQEMADFYDRSKQPFRNMAYRKGITALRQQTHRIKTYEEAIEIPRIGDSLAKKIEEMYKRGRIEKLHYLRLEPRDQVVQIFTKIHGVGISIAERWYDAGYRTLEDIDAKVILTPAQQVGFDHYEDFNTRIPRSEMDSLAAIIKNTAAKLDPEIEITIGGSYRRGAKSSGDIDVMITKPDTTHTSELLPFLGKLADHFEKTGFFVAALAVPAPNDPLASKWMGACLHPVTPEIPKPIWRRIDLLLVPESEWGAALIYFTGDDIFNRSMRLYAGTKKMRLNQRGLYKDVMQGSGRVKMTEGTLVEGKDEKKIFDALGVPYWRPEQRIVGS